jgi:hypothetical protein
VTHSPSAAPHVWPAAQHQLGRLKPAQQTAEGAQQRPKKSQPPPKQHFEGWGQQKAELLAPTPPPPQHESDEEQTVAARKWVQHCEEPSAVMHVGAIDPAPQQVVFCVQFEPDAQLTPAQV